MSSSKQVVQALPGKPSRHHRSHSHTVYGAEHLRRSSFVWITVDGLDVYLDAAGLDRALV